MFKLIYDESGAPVFFPDDIPGSQNIISLSPASGLHAVIFYRYISYAAVAMDSHEPPHERDDDDEGPEDHLGRCETVDVTSSVFPGAAGALEESPPPPQCNLFGRKHVLHICINFSYTANTA